MKYLVYESNGFSLIAPDSSDANSKNYFEFQKVAQSHFPFVLDVDVPKSLQKLDFFFLSGGSLRGLISSESWFLRGLVIDRRLYDVIDNFTLPPHLFEPISVKVKKGMNEKYGYFYQLEGAYQFLDLSGTLFQDFNQEEYFLFKVANLEELKTRTCWRLHTVKLKENFPNYDVFGIFYIDSQIYFSERIAKALLKFGINKKCFVEPRIKFI
jgi:hypothetical protein